MPPRGSHNIAFTAADAVIRPRGYRELEISVDSVDPGEIISLFSPEEIINTIGTGPLLEHMTIKDVIDHFGTDEIYEALDIDPKFM